MEKNIVKRGFGSDNNAGIHPDILKEIIASNAGHVTGYGTDIYTEQARNLFKEYLGSSTETYFVFTGTGANVLGLSAITRSWNSVITVSTAHLEGDECGAPEKFIGCKVLVVDTPDGKITPDLIVKHMHGIDFEHHSQPKVVSITQATEMGTVYSVDEIRAISDFAHSKGMLVHMDGARIANAAVYLNLPFKAFTTDAGVDVLSFGGTKNGMMLEINTMTMPVNQFRSNFSIRGIDNQDFAAYKFFGSSAFISFKMCCRCCNNRIPGSCYC